MCIPKRVTLRVNLFRHLWVLNFLKGVPIGQSHNITSNDPSALRNGLNKTR